ncbi:MAG: hypothetical protein ACQGVK_20995 [Myxococcota bacterium]
MNHRTTSTATLFAMLLLAGQATAGSIVDITLQSGSEGGFGFSTLHSAEAACSFIGDNQFCMNGSFEDAMSGSLTGLRDGLRIEGITGDIALASGNTLSVTGGVFDFSGESQEFDSYLETNYGTFHFWNHTFAGPANGFDGTTLRAWGNNWANEGLGNPGDGYKPWGMDIGAVVSEAPVPEPGAAAVFGLGLLITRVGVRRRG